MCSLLKSASMAYAVHSHDTYYIALVMLQVHDVSCRRGIDLLLKTMQHKAVRAQVFRRQGREVGAHGVVSFGSASLVRIAAEVKT